MRKVYKRTLVIFPKKFVKSMKSPIFLFSEEQFNQTEHCKDYKKDYANKTKLECDKLIFLPESVLENQIQQSASKSAARKIRD